MNVVGFGGNVDISSGSGTMTAPAGSVNGDLWLSFTRARATAAVAPTPVTAGNTMTWTDVLSVGTCQKVSMSVYDGSSPAPSIAAAGTFTCGFLMAIRGQDPTTPIFSVSSPNTPASQANMHYGARTVGIANALIITATSVATAASAVTPDTNFTAGRLLNSAITTMGLFVQYWQQGAATNIAATDLVTAPGAVATQFGCVLVIAPSGGITLVPSDGNLNGGLQTLGE